MHETCGCGGYIEFTKSCVIQSCILHLMKRPRPRGMWLNFRAHAAEAALLGAQRRYAPLRFHHLSRPNPLRFNATGACTAVRWGNTPFLLFFSVFLRTSLQSRCRSQLVADEASLSLPPPALLYLPLFLLHSPPPAAHGCSTEPILK